MPPILQGAFFSAVVAYSNKLKLIKNIFFLSKYSFFSLETPFSRNLISVCLIVCLDKLAKKYFFFSVQTAISL